MSGYHCPLCRHLFVNGPIVNEDENTRFNHFSTKHQNLGIVQETALHCPIMGCQFICSSLENFEFHCEKRHYCSGTYKCKDCPKSTIPFISEIDLVRHELCVHSQNRSKKRIDVNGQCRQKIADINWFVGGYGVNSLGEGKTSVKRLKYN